MASADEQLTPLADQLLVELQEEPTLSAGGILMPNAIAEDETAPFQENFDAQTPRYGTVVAVGGGRRSVASGDAVGMSSFSVGQSVVIKPKVGLKVKRDGKLSQDSLYLFNERDVYAVC